MASASQDLVIRMKTDSQNFNDGIEKAKGKVKDFKREGQGAGDGLKEGMAVAKSAIAKIAVAIGAATAAWKTYKSMAEQTQTWGDELNNTIDACKTTFQGLQREIIMGGDLAVGKLREMYNEAYKLAQLKDQLGTLKISQQWNRGTYLTSYNEAMADYQEAKTKKDAEGMAKAAKEINEALNGYTRESQELIQTTKDEAKQLLIANNISVGANENIYDVMNDVKNAQNGHLMGITETLKELSKVTYTTMYSPTAGAYQVASGGLEWGKSKMRNMGYSDAQIAMAERQLRMSELSDPKYQELVSTLLEGKNVQNEIAALRKRATRTMSATEETTVTIPVKAELETSGMTFDQQMEYLSRAIQNEMLNNDRIKDSAIIEIEVIDDEIIEPETDELLKRVKEAQEAEEALWNRRITNLNAYAASLGSVASIFNSLNSMASDDSPWKKFTAVLSAVASNIMSLINVYTSLIAVEAVAESIKSGEGFPFPYNLVIMAAAGAAIAGIIASIVAASKAQNFATGGIVGGHNYNDGIHANLSSGEMVLNKHQQYNLWSLINGLSVARQNEVSNVVFRINGEDLVGVIDNYNTNNSY